MRRKTLQASFELTSCAVTFSFPGKKNMSLNSNFNPFAHIPHYLARGTQAGKLAKRPILSVVFPTCNLHLQMCYSLYLMVTTTTATMSWPSIQIVAPFSIWFNCHCTLGLLLTDWFPSSVHRPTEIGLYFTKFYLYFVKWALSSFTCTKLQWCLSVIFWPPKWI